MIALVREIACLKYKFATGDSELQFNSFGWHAQRFGQSNGCATDHDVEWMRIHALLGKHPMEMVITIVHHIRSRPMVAIHPVSVVSDER